MKSSVGNRFFFFSNDSNAGQDDNESKVLSQALAAMQPFEWYFPALSGSNESQNRQHWEDKHEEILVCLQGEQLPGSVGEYVDLWKLRELALQPGGLLSPQLRKRAWPTLLGCHAQILSRYNQSSPLKRTTTPSLRDLQTLKKDVGRTIWNVQDHLMASKYLQKQQDDQMRALLQMERRKRVSFAPLATVASPTSIGSDLASPASMSSAERFSVEKEESSRTYLPQKVVVIKNNMARDVDDTKEPEISDDTDDDTVLSVRSGTISVDTAQSQGENSLTLSSRVVRWRRPSKQEQKVLFNIISSLLRTEAQASDYFEDDRYRYFAGLPDLTAVLVINLESPSLSNLVLQQLAQAHFRDALRKDCTILDMALAGTVIPLLELVDAPLYRHLMDEVDQALSPLFCRSWIAAWFTQDVVDVRVASRIMDVMIVSHPLTVVYLAVSVLTVGRQMLLFDDQISVIHPSLRDFAAQTLTMDQVETVIAQALDHMKKVPPAVLIDHAYNRTRDDKIHAISFFQEPPSWIYRDHAPNDWTLLQRASALRMNPQLIHQQQDQCVQVESNMTLEKRHPLAMSAVGRTANKRNKPLFILALVLIVLAVSVLVGGGQAFPNNIKSLLAEHAEHVTKLWFALTKKTSAKKTQPSTSFWHHYLEQPLFQREASNNLKQSSSSYFAPMLSSVKTQQEDLPVTEEKTSLLEWVKGQPTKEESDLPKDETTQADSEKEAATPSSASTLVMNSFDWMVESMSTSSSTSDATKSDSTKSTTTKTTHEHKESSSRVGPLKWVRRELKQMLSRLCNPVGLTFDEIADLL